jgi:Tol biopolymer transport system component
LAQPDERGVSGTRFILANDVCSIREGFMSRTVSASTRAFPARLVLHITAAITLTFLLVACSDSTSPPPLPVVTQVIVQPADVNTLKVGDQFTFSARILDQKGREIEDRYATWSSTSEAVATVNMDGVVTGLSTGTTSIVAKVGEKFGSVTLNVSLYPVSSVEISTPQVHLFEGESRSLVAIVRGPENRVLNGREVTWSTNDAGTVSVDATGRLTAIKSGAATITASIEGKTATAAVTVGPAPVDEVIVSPAGVVLEVGEQRQYQVVLKDAFGNVLQGRNVLWTADNGTVMLSQTGVVTGVRNGYVTLIATSEGVSGTVGATIVAPEPYAYDLVYYRQNGFGASELFVLDLATGAAPSRLNAGNVSRMPTASPDGSRVAFAVSMNDLTTGAPIDDIFAVDRNGMNMRQLTTAIGYDDSPEWSPAGGRIAYHHLELTGRSDIFVMNEDGSNQVSLTSDMPASGFRSAPTWTRDGSRIAFSQTENTPAGTAASIWIMNADGSGKRQVTLTLTGFDASPTWSPDGQKLAFVRYYGSEGDITIIDVSSGALTRVPLDGIEANPAWSPDGDLIVFTRGSGIYTMAPNGSNVRLRTVDPNWGGGIAPSWISR